MRGRSKQKFEKQFLVKPEGAEANGNPETKEIGGMLEKTAMTENGQYALWTSPEGERIPLCLPHGLCLQEAISMIDKH